MKKILAIALAVAMVLTMASAFAWDWSWTCPTTADKTGKVAVEVVPYVKVNNGCGGYDWVQSNCAGTVASENVYFLVKLTIDKNINPVWYKHITETQGVVLSTTKGGFVTDDGATVASAYKATVPMPETSPTLLPTDTSKDGWTFYLNPAVTTSTLDATKAAFTGVGTNTDISGAKWVETAEDDLTVTDFMFGFKVANASKAKVCAKLTSDFDGKGEWLTFGDYKILVLANTITIIPACISTDAVATGDAVATKTAVGGRGILDTNSFEMLTLTITDGKVWVANAVGATSCTGTFANNALNFFGIQLGTCVNDDNIRANFGWKDKVESCFTWSGNATAIVDVQCEVEIPKTGDVSVIAYAVMAVVAAAGAMGLKK